MNFFVDREPTRPLERIRMGARQDAAVVGNERMTALAGTVLLVLIVAEIVIAAKLHALMPIHMYVGCC